MSVISTRLTEDGELAAVWPMAREIAFGSQPGGTAPFENLLLPKATIQVLHAEIEQDGWGQFSPSGEGDFEVDPDALYKVKTYSGTHVVPDGQEMVTRPDPLPPDYEDEYNFFAYDIEDDRVMTYELHYSAEDTEEDPDGWILTETGTREVGERYIYSTGTLEDAPEINEIDGDVLSPTEYDEGGEAYGTGKITITLSLPVTVTDLTAYTTAKLNDLKDRADDVVPEPEEGEEPTGPPPVTFETDLDCYRTDALKIKVAAVRMVWEGSGMFAPLAGTLHYFASAMAPSFSLTVGTWEIAVSSPIASTEKYFDARGVYGDENWWDSEHSYFAGSGDVFFAPTAAQYPGSGLDSEAAYEQLEYQWFSMDGKKRRLTIRHSYDSETEEYTTESRTMAVRDGFANATSWVNMVSSPGGGIFIDACVRIEDDGSEVVEYEAGSPVIETVILGVRYKSRLAGRWGYQGYSGLIPVAEGTEPTILETRYKTVTVSSTGLEYATRPPTTTPPGVGRSATASMSGSLTLDKPSDWKLGSLKATGRFSKTHEDTASPFSLAWTASGHTGVEEITVNLAGGLIPMVSFPPFLGTEEERTITETSYQVTRDTPPTETLPVRTYRMRWIRNQDSHSNSPTIRTETFALAAPATGETRQVSAWKDLDLPAEGESWWTEPDDEYACFVGEV